MEGVVGGGCTNFPLGTFFCSSKQCSEYVRSAVMFWSVCVGKGEVYSLYLWNAWCKKWSCSFSCIGILCWDTVESAKMFWSSVQEAITFVLLHWHTMLRLCRECSEVRMWEPHFPTRRLGARSGWVEVLLMFLLEGSEQNVAVFILSQWPTVLVLYILTSMLMDSPFWLLWVSLKIYRISWNLLFRNFLWSFRFYVSVIT